MIIRELTEPNILLFDGGMGTMLQAAGMPAGALPEIFGLEHGDVVTDIHRQYVTAGAQVITANTFQCNDKKLAGSGHTVEEVIHTSIGYAKAAGAPYVALDIGPLGELLEPMGTLTFEKAYNMFARQVIAGRDSGADVVLIETISDLYEAKAAVLAAKEHSSLPIICTMTYQNDGRTFVGCDPVTATITLCSLGVSAVGVNCSLGPRELHPVVEQVLQYASVPVIVQANAGLPVMENGITHFPIQAKEYAELTAAFVRNGVRILGGCCGTTPDFIRAIAEETTGIASNSIARRPLTATTSGNRTVFLDNKITMIGERINPTGKKKLKEALRNNQIDYIINEALSQVDAGAEVLDVNVGLPELDEPVVLSKTIKEIQAMVTTPLQVDSSDPLAIEAGVRVYNGKPIINSVNGKRSSMGAIFPIAQKYGALVIGLTLDENGIPPTAEQRLLIAERIVNEAAEYGIPREDILIDCLVLTASAQQAQVLETIKAIKLVKSKLGVKTVLGVSNVSFGLPSRERLNAVFLTAAFGAGLDAPILNPLAKPYQDAVTCFRVLNNEDMDAIQYISAYANEAQPSTASKLIDVTSNDPQNLGSPKNNLPALSDIIIQGRKEEAIPKVQDLLKTMAPLSIIDEQIIPALDIVGKQFESGALFLPQLMQSAEAVKRGFAVIKEHMNASGEVQKSKGRILLATVQGDIHDIGKNIVKMMLENYGYDIVDLGKDVPIDTVVETIEKEKITLAGLSALMTTTVQSMKDTIALAKKKNLDCHFMVGGAVLNTEYADFVGADFYARDAMESVTIANQFFQP